jgi:hypothetical protein
VGTILHVKKVLKTGLKRLKKSPGDGVGVERGKMQNEK